jgi:hypothetical protein
MTRPARVIRFVDRRTIAYRPIRPSGSRIRKWSITRSTRKPELAGVSALRSVVVNAMSSASASAQRYQIAARHSRPTTPAATARRRAPHSGSRGLPIRAVRISTTGTKTPAVYLVIVASVRTRPIRTADPYPARVSPSHRPAQSSRIVRASKVPSQLTKTTGPTSRNVAAASSPARGPHSVRAMERSSRAVASTHSRLKARTR